VVISATGVWSGETQDLADVSDPLRVRSSKGVHLIVRRSRLQLSTGLITRTERSVLFVIPWGDFWIIGTTDTDYTADKDRPVASVDDVEYLLAHVNSVLVTPLGREDIVGVYAGLRPLLDGGATATAKLSREHAVSLARPGFVVVAGGKFTTYRVMAADAVDRATTQLDRAVPASRTRDVVIVGGDDWDATWSARHELAAVSGLSEQWIDHLLRRYGSLTSEVLDAIRDDRSLASPLEGSDHYLKGEISYAVTHEGALHLEDVLTRRTHVSIQTTDHGARAARHAADVVAPLLGWGPDRVKEELDEFDATAESW
jgi:glycerol-3-phosphate dehydrogenase